MANGQLSKEDFQSLPVSKKLDWIYDTLAPMNEDYNNFQIIKKFGIGIGTLIVGVVGVGSGVLWIVGIIKGHIPGV